MREGIPETPADLVWRSGPVCGPPRFAHDTVLLFKRPSRLRNGQVLCPYVSVLRARDVEDTEHDFEGQGGERSVLELAVWTIDDEAFEGDPNIDRCDFWAYLGPHDIVWDDDEPNEPFVPGRVVVLDP